jgi:putative copper export protein
MISPTLDSLRVFLHLIAVAIWVGGQIVLAGIVPSLRTVAPDAMKTVAQGFARIAWPAFLVIVFTGMWGLGTIDVSAISSEYLATFGIKMLLVGIAVIATLIHSNGTSKAAKGIGGAASLLTSLLAAFAGILMAHVG